LLIEFAQRQQQEPQLYRPTPITPATADVNLLSSAIASLANNSPPGAVQSQGLLNTLGINNQQQSSFSLSAPNASLFVGVGPSHQQPNIPVVQQQSAGLPTQIQHTVETQASISQRNLQVFLYYLFHKMKIYKIGTCFGNSAFGRWQWQQRESSCPLISSFTILEKILT
jgi:hypothetical protein